ncbi:hypothetical protein WR25_22271 [Diploscapter pachys]|uniref:Uncharacterized protein n=1 Tax=Diploscapter pachys TaxID=2018661 RepID=A0A2A2L5J2_9BILA|nr:hypothetical protein WR25_22271 [Diploscapter pachys]
MDWQKVKKNEGMKEKEEVRRNNDSRKSEMAWIAEPLMESIPEEGGEDGEWVIETDTGKRTVRKREVFTSQQINTLVRFAQFFPLIIVDQ